jgi:hypothetical protein
MVPLVHGVDETYENPAVVTPEQRWKYYGSDHHVRQYGKRDFLRRLGMVGFDVEQFGIEHFGQETFRRAAIAQDSILYIGRRPA